MRLSRRQGWVLAGLLLTMVTPCAAGKVFIDYDHDADFSSFKTFAYKASPESLAQKSPLMDKRIVESIKAHLAQSGLKQTSGKGDLTVTYHVSTQENQEYITTGFGGGFGGGWGGGWGRAGGGWNDSTTTVENYETGTLVIDAMDAAKNKLVWRGSASTIVPKNPEKGAKKIEKSIDAMAEKWQELHAKR